MQRDHPHELRHVATKLQVNNKELKSRNDITRKAKTVNRTKRTRDIFERCQKYAEEFFKLVRDTELPSLKESKKTEQGKLDLYMPGCNVPLNPPRLSSITTTRVQGRGS